MQQETVFFFIYFALANYGTKEADNEEFSGVSCLYVWIFLMAEVQW